MPEGFFIDDLGGIEPIPDHATQVFAGEIYSVWQWKQAMYDGSLVTYEGLKRPDTVHTVGVLDDGQILLTEDTQPNRRAVLTPPGGKVEPGEEPAAAARREFEEETGYIIGELAPWHYYRGSSKVECFVHAFIGRHIRQEGKRNLDGGEKIEVRLFSFDEFLQLGRTPQLRDRILRTILLEALLDNTKKEALHALLYG